MDKKNRREKVFSVLIDPDKLSEKQLEILIAHSVDAKVDLLLIGGSLITNNKLDLYVKIIKSNCNIPIFIFPGNNMQISTQADGILLLSLISGRNPDLLIGQHVLAAPTLHASSLEIIPTGYMLIYGGNVTSAQYMSNTQPIPHTKIDIAVCTALAGEQLGMKMIYMDGGSGAEKPIITEMIKEVKRHISIPLIVGGGITSPAKAQAICGAGADMIVVGNAIEKKPSLIREIGAAIHNTIAS